MPEDRSPRRRPDATSRRREPARHFGRWSWLFAGSSLAAAALATYFVLHSSLLAVHEVRVQGVDSLDAASVAELSGLGGKSMLALPLDQARDNLMALAHVRSVSFARDWPGRGVTIHIEERVPYALWSTGGRDYPVDVDGYVLAAGAPSGPAPRIVDLDPARVMGPGDRIRPDALALAARIINESPRFLGQRVESLEYRSGVGVIAVFAKGMRVTFGDERSYEYKVAVLAKLLDQLTARGVTPRAVDLRFGERVTYE